jgi:gluconate 2-dehydrogenase gamma chain
MDDHQIISRKEAIRRTAIIMGGVVFAPSILGVLKGCKATPNDEWIPELFSQRQARLMNTLVDVILPEDDTPSASQAGVTAFIESMVKNVYNQEQRNLFLKGLDQFDEEATLELEGDFYDMTDEIKYEYTYGMNRVALESGRGSGGERPFILILRELTILGYFTSEVGATQVLRYEPVPGVYRGCVPFEEIGKTWAV